MSCIASSQRFFLRAINFALACLGLAASGYAIHLIQKTHTLFTWMLLILGVYVSLLGLSGFLGASLKSRNTLFFYAVQVFGLLIAQGMSAALLLLSPFLGRRTFTLALACVHAAVFIITLLANKNWLIEKLSSGGDDDNYKYIEDLVRKNVTITASVSGVLVFVEIIALAMALNYRSRLGGVLSLDDYDDITSVSYRSLGDPEEPRMSRTDRKRAELDAKYGTTRFSDSNR
ncbi:MAG: hypothetical protein MHM6MM_005339 [Cercozoa sp. M6MM]